MLMTRWDYDTVFYRVFCTALLGIALTFTVILTNVFIDIDGLLYKKNKANTDKVETVQANVDVITTNIKPEDDAYDYKDYSDYAERTKRSLETQDFSYHIKDPKMKKVITNRLAALLEDLDKQNTDRMNHKDKQNKSNENYKSFGKSEKYIDINGKYSEKEKLFTKSYKADMELLDKKSREDIDDNIELINDIERIKKEKDKKRKSNHTEDELKHLAMHNIILQGIIRHMDLGEVYAKVHALIHNLDAPDVNIENWNKIMHPSQDKQFFNELVNCKQLRDQIITESTKLEPTTHSDKEIKKTMKPAGRNVMIKTIIDITSLANDKTNQDDGSKENVNGIIKLIYNGKSLKFKRIDDFTSTAVPMFSRQMNEKIQQDRMNNIENIKEAEDKILNDNRDPNTYVPIMMNKMFGEYIKTLTKGAETFDTKKSTSKRLKRHIKIRYENDETNTSEKPKSNGKGDDELYVEIETHFDGKGLKGEKKTKKIKELIEKIQKALHSDKEKKKKHKHLHVKKRIQNPLDSENTTSFVNKVLFPIDSLAHRQIDPISKSVALHEKIPYVSNDKGGNWRRHYHGPRFLTASKAINSAEMSELDTDYNKILVNGIPERLQKPLNTENVEETLNFDDVQENNAKFIVKNIANSGFSIGFNQYVDEPPDAESMKLFTGIENIIQTYHQKYDEEGANADQDNKKQNQEYINQEYPKDREEPANYENPAPVGDDHMIVRRSIKKFKQDYHSNEYKVILNKKILNYNDYQDVFNGKGHYSTSKNRKTNPLVIDDNIFNKELKPAEIFNLAEILDRQKRSVNVKKISNIKSKKKLNRYLNTNSMASKKIFQQNKRSKRQINKIRIIAKDISNNQKHNSEEDIFVFSDEKIFADRAVVKEVETPEMDPRELIKEEHYDVITPQKPSEEHFDSPQKNTEDHYDIITPQKAMENHYDIISPYGLEASPMDANVFTRRSRHNSLMSKYPHVFMDEIARSKEEEMISDSRSIYGKVMEQLNEITTQIAPVIVPIPETPFIPEHKFKNSDVQEIVNPPHNKENYKVTVKIMPKNNTGLNSGFKEIHTSINKSYNKNGLVYTSLVNVSEISKVEKINKTKEKYGLVNPSASKLKKDQLRMKSLIQQHKDRIEEQLAHLNKEKESLDHFDIRSANYLQDGSKDVNVVGPVRGLHVTQEDLGRLFNMEETTLQPTTPKPTTTTTTTTTEYVPTTEDQEKLKIINTIERNENITNEILQKIDKNTNILQTFLNKLISKMDAMDTQKLDNKKVNFEEQKNENIVQIKDIYENNIPGLFFKQMPRNNTAIPFVYAFQQPYTIPNGENKDVPIASVVYQGHIHAQTYRPQMYARKNMNKKSKGWKEAVKDEVKNSSKFFIDELENEYKVLPVVGKSVFPTNVTNV